MLDKEHINYITLSFCSTYNDVETLRIKYFDSQSYTIKCAIPDFYLIDSNTIVEIKSNYTLDIQNMKDKFKAYQELGYNVKLILEHEEVNLFTL